MTLSKLSIKITFKPTLREPSDVFKNLFLISSLWSSIWIFKFLNSKSLKIFESSSLMLISSISYNFLVWFFAYEIGSIVWNHVEFLLIVSFGKVSL